MAKLGIIIANTGSPSAASPEAVKSYLAEFLTDKHIMPMNPLMWKLLLNTVILPARSKASAQKYASIWTEQGSPLTVIMASLAQKLEAALGKQGYDVRVVPAASYGSPSLGEALSTCVHAGCSEIVVVPLYPQSAFSTTKVVEDRAYAAWESMQTTLLLPEAPVSTTLHITSAYSTNSCYLQALVHTIQAVGFGSEPHDKLLFAFHSVPLCNINEGDTYDAQVRETTHALAHMLDIAPSDWALGFQCRFDRARTWLSPFVSEAIENLKAQGPIGRLFVIAPNFSVDCLETLYDIDLELREEYKGDLIYIPCLNDSENQVALLIDHLSDYLSD